MKNKILWSVLVASFIIAAFSIALTLQASTNVMGQKQEDQLRELVNIVYRGYKEIGEGFISEVDTDSYNITIMSPSGKVINDEFEEAWYLVTDQKAIELFLSKVLDEPEAIVSTNTPFLFGRLILAGISSEDGSVVIATSTLKTFKNTISDMKIELVYILLVAILISIGLANLISFFIVSPLNKIDVEKPQEKDAGKYKEILPLVNKIQKQKIDIQNKERKLSEEQSQFYAVSESLREGLILINNTDSIIYINSSAKRILKLNSFHLGDNYHNIFNEALQTIVENTIKEGPQTTILYEKSNSYQVETTFIMNNEKYKGISLLIYDVTKRIEIENQRREFTANVSHELKTPLHIIAGSAELLQSGLVKKEDQDQFISQIYNESKRMGTIIEDIIKLSKLDEKAVTIDQEVINVKAVALTILSRLSNVAQERKIKLIVTGKDIFIKSNPSMFNQILYNLADNALKYTNAEGTVEIKTTQKDDIAIIEVIDNGIGIPPEYKDRIFERFFRVDKSRSKEVGGTGLGLAIVKHSCLINGGNIEVDSTLGKGSIFRVTFPLVKPEEAEDL